MRSISANQMNYTVDRNSVKQRKFIVEQCRKYKIPTGMFSDENNSIYTEIEKKAIDELETELKISEETAKKLIETMQERQERNLRLNITE